MTTLITCMGEGKGTWMPVARVINDLEWSHIFIITNDFFKDKISIQKPHTIIVLDQQKDIEDLIVDLLPKLRDVRGDVAINLLSGTGKDHMAIMAALLQLGVGIRFIALTKEGVSEI